ncbi:hypothetical protein EDC96DRAFT_446725 [Choanephora cucurbitarum]|nr:hypothetical protein EDC96DRAFT_446725 [Choanephora cucurbitarum]
MFSKNGWTTPFLHALSFLQPYSTQSTHPFLVRFQSAIDKKSLKLAKIAYAKLDFRRMTPDRSQIHQLLMLARRGKRADDIEFIDRVIQDMRRAKIRPGHFEYHALMYAYGLHRLPEQSYAILHRMQQEERLVPNLYSYNTLLACFKRANDRSRAERVWQEMRQAQIQPDTVSYNTMLHLLSQQHQFQAGFDLYQQMLMENVSPDLYTYSTLLDMSVESNDPGLGQSIYSTLLSYGRLDLRTFHSMLRFISTVDIQQALDLYHRLPTDYPYLQPDVVTCNIMLDLCLRHGHYSKAYMIFRDAKVQPDAITYGTLIDAEVRQGDVKSALQLFYDMRRASIEPNERIINSLMNMASIKSIRPSQLDTLLTLAEQHASQLDKKSYHALMHGLAQEGRSDQVQQLYDTVFRHPQPGFEPDIVTMTHLVLAYIHNDQLEDAMAIYRVLKEHHQRSSVKYDIKLDATFYATLIAALSHPKHTRALAAAVTLFNDMRPFQIQPSMHAYTAMLHACGQHQDEAMLHQVHQLIKVDLFLDPDIGIYNALMDAYNRIGDGETVLEIWHTLTLPGTAQVEPDPISVSIVLDSCGHNGLVHKAPLIWSWLKKRKFELNTNNYNSYIECLCRAQGRHGWDAAYRLVKQEMALPSDNSDRPKIDQKTVNTLMSFARKKMFDVTELEALEQWGGSVVNKL